MLFRSPSDVCYPSWLCDGYGSCLINDTQSCNAVVDAYLCGVNYTGDYSEFTPQSCNYCTALATSQSVNLGNGTCAYTFNNTNWATCCDVTGHTTDCQYTFTIPAMTINFTSNQIQTANLACSAFIYTSEDLAPIAISGIGSFLVVLVS